MQFEFFVEYGCYLELIGCHVVVDAPEGTDVEEVRSWLYNEMYPLAYGCTEGWYGMHGFVLTDDDNDEILDFNGDEPIYEEFLAYLNDNTEITVEDWVTDVHEGMLNYHEVEHYAYTPKQIDETDRRSDWLGGR